jgi:hypothetical protein
MKLFLVIFVFCSWLSGNPNSDPYARYRILQTGVDIKYSSIQALKSTFPISEQFEKIRRERDQRMLRARKLYQRSENTQVSTRLKGQVMEATFLRRLRNYNIKVKQGVDLRGMNVGLYRSLGSIKRAFQHLPIVVTSGKEGTTHKHGGRSHYKGYKLDLRVRDYRFVKIRDNTIIKGRQQLQKIVRRLNEIPGIFAMLEDVINYPHIDLQYIGEG